MATDRRPIVLPPMPVSDFLAYILQHHAAPTTLIICSTRESFLSDLSAAIRERPPANPTADGASSPPPRKPPSIHSLLIPTIHLISTSRTIALAFTPTLPHLRAYLSSYIPPMAMEPQPHFSKPGIRTCMLAVLNPLALQRSTTDFSAQGLSRTFAAAVEAAERANMQLVVEETEARHDGEADNDMHVRGNDNNSQGGGGERGGKSSEGTRGDSKYQF